MTVGPERAVVAVAAMDEMVFGMTGRKTDGTTGKTVGGTVEAAIVSRAIVGQMILQIGGVICMLGALILLVASITGAP